MAKGAGAPVNHLFPSLGSIVSRELGQRGNIPSYINLPDPMEAGGPGFYGAEHAPFVLETDPVQPDFEVRDLRLVPGVDGRRFENRRESCSGVIDKIAAAPPTARPSVMSTYYEKAYQMITAPDARKAFDIMAESDKTRERYGFTSARSVHGCWHGVWSRPVRGSSASTTARGIRISRNFLASQKTLYSRSSIASASAPRWLPISKSAAYWTRRSSS